MQWRRRGIQKKRSERGGIRAGDEVGVGVVVSEMAESCVPSRGMADLIEHLLLARHQVRIDTLKVKRQRDNVGAAKSTNVLASAGLCRDSSLGQDSTLEAEKEHSQPPSTPPILRRLAGRSSRSLMTATEKEAVQLIASEAGSLLQRTQ